LPKSTSEMILSPVIPPFSHGAERAAHSHTGGQEDGNHIPSIQLGESIPQAGAEPQVMGIPIPQMTSQQFPQAMMSPNYCGGGNAVVWVPWQNVAGVAGYQQGASKQQPQEPAPPSSRQQRPPQDCAPLRPQRQKPRLSTAAAEALSAKYHLQVPQAVKVLQAELREKQEQHRHCSDDAHRAEQLREELRLVDEMKCQLIAQAEEVLDWQLQQVHERQLLRNLSDQHDAEPGSWGPPQEAEQMMNKEAVYQSHRLPVHASVHRPVTATAQRPPPTAKRGRLRGQGGAGEEPPRGPVYQGRQAMGPTAGIAAPPSLVLASVEPGGDPRAPSGTSTMKSQLQALQNEDPSTVFIARRINKLGFASADQLRSYFSRYGEVKCVYVSHSRVKSIRPDSYWRMRAASLGFVVMFSANATARILADGPEHAVGDASIRVHMFHRHGNNMQEDDSESHAGDNDMEASANEPGQSQLFAGKHLDGYDVQYFTTGLKESDLPYCDNMPLAASLARFSEQELYNAQPARYED